MKTTNEIKKAITNVMRKKMKKSDSAESIMLYLIRLRDTVWNNNREIRNHCQKNLEWMQEAIVLIESM